MENRTFIIVPIGAILMIIFTVFMYYYTSNEKTTYINSNEDYTKSENPEMRKLALQISHLSYCRYLYNNDIEQIQRFEKKFPDVEYIDYCKKNKHSNSNDSEKFYKKFNY
ncbi:MULTISPECIES: hypothetical protein [Aliarcobacter]|uniref:hypothetical protein n=1 Tax=Aliarcobacter TaxID=2321111 RepID=UPI001260EBD0|nr:MULTISPECIES: hypothetical protein [Aliarcobacter]MCT7526400.1 hypothetical protein [Aliarcobacter cryaerophilus]MCT7541412.1 hypothetical protein [Aliarcobacter cryaerophilus]